MALLPQSDPDRPEFEPETLDSSVIALPLLAKLDRLAALEKKAAGKTRLKAPEADELRRLREEGKDGFPVIIDLNLLFPGEKLDNSLLPAEFNDMTFGGGRKGARDRVKVLLIALERELEGEAIGGGINEIKSRFSDQYLFATLHPAAIRRLVELDGASKLPEKPATGEKSAEGTSDSPVTKTTGVAKPPVSARAIYHIWPDFQVKRLTTKSASTVKVDAARVAFGALGEEIVWAVIDSGIDQGHPHFDNYKNLKLPPPLRHLDFTTNAPEVVDDKDNTALTDEFGHGTHVAGIIAGEARSDGEKELVTVSRYRDEKGDVSYSDTKVAQMSGMAPKCKLLSLKVLDAKGNGQASSLIAALEYIQELNSHGRHIKVHGVNLSVGYSFEPEWFACGQSPLCVEVDRLVRSGVVVVVAAGNTGYGWAQSSFRGNVTAGLDLTINDPGNADLAITVGSTHREAPHTYGVSYFCSKGPTGDGRLKPDLLAPGEKILSCAAGVEKDKVLKKLKPGSECHYLEQSGTSMAAPHVSGVIAAFLSVRAEFRGQPERVKEIFLSTATDLRRERSFQGYGLIDMMRAIQSV